MAILSGRQRHAIAVLAICISTPAGSATTEPSGLTASEIKAGFLFNFTKFVEWPREAFADANAPIVLGIVGTNPFGSLLTEATLGKTVNGRAVIERQFKAEGDLRTCQILFVSPSENRGTAQILERLKGTSVLTVGEGDRFTQAGGMIAFVVEGNKVRLLINLEASTEAHLKISAQVIAVARIVVQTKARN
jgi:hypothetical protein